MYRNNHFEGYEESPGGWNFVFVGNDNQPAGHCSNTGVHYTTAKATPRSAEKPYIAADYVDHTKFNLIVPAMEYGLEGQSFH